MGWGFTVFNGGPDFAVIAGSDYLTTTPLGNYTDLIGPQFIVVGPDPENTTSTQAFDSIALSGMGEYAISRLAQVGAQSTGTILLTIDLFSTDPNSLDFDPNSRVGSEYTISADASIDVTPGSNTPEPGLGLWTGLLALAICGCQRLKKRPHLASYADVRRRGR